MERKLAILGSTGSIGQQSLDVIDRNPGKFRVQILTAESNSMLLVRQALHYKPEAVVIVKENLLDEVTSLLKGTGIRIYGGHKALSEALRDFQPGIVLNALVGFAGLLPTLTGIECGMDICLANKESLVVAGELITGMKEKFGSSIIPVDSEHSAIFQCLQGEQKSSVKRLYLTASGGPFRGRSADYLEHVTREEALAHPTWQMGPKITVDSATLMNKGLEIIEARWLFGVEPENIRVVIHPESVVHSMVQFVDGSVKAQLSPPDMRLAIHYALNYPERTASGIPEVSFEKPLTLTFEPPDTKKFRNLALAVEALERGGNAPCVLNAANEIAVKAFLDGKIGFLDIGRTVETCLNRTDYIRKPDIEDLISTDKLARVRAGEVIDAFIYR
ncbi:MAG: 1-deoxy-D-xylulose-5-phosphate reductoisomerase [Bacteroidales bacterium]|nr:1-deoxy-D-xylulose-5-phosphate reductoisomerase [Bacteroidales bacterium]